MGVIEFVFELQELKAKIKVVLAGHIVAMTTYYMKKMIANCIPLIWNLSDTIIAASLVKQ